jgi:membrane protease YdiL (CAAX protease family)
VGTTLVVGALAIVNVAKHRLPPGDVSLSAVAALALLVAARRSGLSWEQLGLGKEQMRSGGLWALTTLLLVSGVYAAGVVLPWTRGAFLDSRHQQELPHALVSALLVIPLGTVLLEEVAFRSVLWGMLQRHTTTRGALTVSSALFGLWHILPSLHSTPGGQGSDVAVPRRVSEKVLVALGTVAFTAAGGAVAGEMRRRSGSVLASAGMHWATNGLGVLFALAAGRLERRRHRALSEAHA